jgi:hypothetical protein
MSKVASKADRHLDATELDEALTKMAVSERCQRSWRARWRAVAPSWFEALNLRGLGPPGWLGQLAKSFNNLARAYSLRELVTNGPALMF